MASADRTPLGFPLSTISGHASLRDVRRRWGLAPGDLDANAIIEQLDEVWRRWTNRQRLLLLDAAEAVAQAERLRTARHLNPAARRRHQKIAQDCVAAAKLAVLLARGFPPPWRGSSQSVGDTILGLVDFALSGLRETARSEEVAAFEVARQALLELRQQTPRVAGRAPWQLVGRLAWLAAGKSANLDRLWDDESVTRRFAQRTRSLRVPPGAPVWPSGFPHLVAAARMVSASGHTIEYCAAPTIRKYLRGSRKK